MEREQVLGTGVPDVQVDDFGVIVRGRSFWGEVLAPATTGDGWGLFILFRDHIVRRGPWSVHEVNLQTGRVTPHVGTGDEPSQILAFPDGRVYVAVRSVLHRLDPDTRSFEEVQLPDGDYWLWRPRRDGTIILYSTGICRAVGFDPAAGTVVDYGRVGHDQGYVMARMWEYGDVSAHGEILTPLAVDDRCLYIVTGQLPRALWAFDLETREQRMLLSIVDPDRMALTQRGEGCYALVRRAKGDQVYRLAFAAADRIEALPPCSKEAAPTVAGVKRPELPGRMALPVHDYQGTGMCEADGTATVHYRPAGGDWQAVTFDLGDYPSYLFRMGTTRDGRLLGSTEDPYTIFQFDPRTRQKEILGASPYYTHTYGFAELGDRIYFAGYTGSPLFAYDPTREWTYQPSRPGVKVPLPEDAEANPRLVARMPRMRRAYDIAAAADQRLYLACSAELTGPWASGGGLGWYEPATGESGLIRDGFEFHRGDAILPAVDGRYVVVTASAWWSRTVSPEKSRVPHRVVTYDVETGGVIGNLEPLPDGVGATTLVEWRPGLVVGRFSAAGGEEAAALFFVLDVVAQEILGTYRLPGRSSARLLRLPDGGLLGYHDGRVYRLDPDRWAFDAMSALSTPPGDWRVVDDRVYAFLGTRLVRLQ